MEAPAAGVRRASRRLNDAFLTIRPRLLPVSSIPIYLSIGISDHLLRYWPLDGTGYATTRWTVEVYLVPRLHHYFKRLEAVAFADADFADRGGGRLVDAAYRLGE